MLNRTFRDGQGKEQASNKGFFVLESTKNAKWSAL